MANRCPPPGTAHTSGVLNLASEWPQAPRVDLALLRNVLIYFAPETEADVLRRLADRMTPDGYLVLGAAEVQPCEEAYFVRHACGRTALYEPGSRAIEEGV